mmetsp:Transcript_68301/g.135352  ORF Transcript_68301/g.135352 Transcript_68301/m.135352 type:complete len:104 (-) Transcript_68301:374-685(-)
MYPTAATQASTATYSSAGWYCMRWSARTTISRLTAARQATRQVPVLPSMLQHPPLWKPMQLINQSVERLKREHFHLEQLDSRCRRSSPQTSEVYPQQEGEEHS